MNSEYNSTDTNIYNQFSQAQENRIQGCLTDFVKNTPANLALLATRCGVLFQKDGTLQAVDATALASLAAGALAAGQQLASFLEDGSTNAVLLREGKRYNLFIAPAGEWLVLVTVVEKRIMIGWARNQVKKLVKALEEIEPEDCVPSPSEALGIVGASISDVLSDAFEDLWTD